LERAIPIRGASGKFNQVLAAGPLSPVYPIFLLKPDCEMVVFLEVFRGSREAEGRGDEDRAAGWRV
jgi:hypothetical protein